MRRRKKTFAFFLTNLLAALIMSVMILISSRDNPHIKAALKGTSGTFLLEGFRLCADALASGFMPEKLFLTAQARERYPTAPLEQAAEQVFGITQPVARRLGDTQSPQGVFGVFEKQETRGKRQDISEPGGRYLALENIQDPGNLGGIARTAEALGLDGLLVHGGCDVYHPKALRASMGALLRLPVMQVDDLPTALRGSKLPCYAAVPDRDAMPVTQCNFFQGTIIAIGSEAQGLSQEAIAACAHKITIPMPGGAESLNAAAAAAILIWEMAKQMQLTIDS